MLTRLRHKLAGLLLRPEYRAMQEAGDDPSNEVPDEAIVATENQPHVFGHFNLIDEEGFEIRVGGLAKYPLGCVSRDGDGDTSSDNGPDDREHRGQAKTR